jgi:hypothetical protein
MQAAIDQCVNSPKRHANKPATSRLLLILSHERVGEATVRHPVMAIGEGRRGFGGIWPDAAGGHHGTPPASSSTEGNTSTTAQDPRQGEARSATRITLRPSLKLPLTMRCKQQAVMARDDPDPARQRIWLLMHFVPLSDFLSR